MKILSILCLLFVCHCGVSSAKNLPPFIKKCSKADTIKLEQCLVQRIRELKPRLIHGIPELKLPPIEPLSIPKFEIHTGNGNAVAFDAILTNVIARGVKDVDVQAMSIDFTKYLIHLHVKIPKLEVEGQYDFNGKVLVFEIQSKGPMNVNVSNIDSVADVKFKVTENQGKKYLIFEDDYKLNNKYDKLALYFENLFPNNQQLTEQVNAAINENALELAKDVNPLIFDSIHLLVVGIINPIFTEYSLKELFDD